MFFDIMSSLVGLYVQSSRYRTPLRFVDTPSAFKSHELFKPECANLRGTQSAELVGFDIRIPLSRFFNILSTCST